MFGIGRRVGIVLGAIIIVAILLAVAFIPGLIGGVKLPLTAVRVTVIDPETGQEMIANVDLSPTSPAEMMSMGLGDGIRTVAFQPLTSFNGEAMTGISKTRHYEVSVAATGTLAMTDVASISYAKMAFTGTAGQLSGTTLGGGSELLMTSVIGTNEYSYTIPGVTPTTTGFSVDMKGSGKFWDMYKVSATSTVGTPIVGTTLNGMVLRVCFLISGVDTNNQVVFGNTALADITLHVGASGWSAGTIVATITAMQSTPTPA